MSKIEMIIEVSGWEKVKQAALTTIHKSWAGGEVTSEWKQNIILSRHSPLRELRVEIEFPSIPRWIADQLVRHTVGVNNYMGTMRSDRGGKDRTEQRMSDLTCFKQVYNGESFLKMCETRLCVGCVSKETREIVEEIVIVLSDIEPELAAACVPPCIRYFGCKEVGFTKCNYFNKFLNSAIEYDLVISDFADIDYRISYYNLHKDE